MSDTFCESDIAPYDTYWDDVDDDLLMPSCRSESESEPESSEEDFDESLLESNEDPPAGDNGGNSNNNMDTEKARTIRAQFTTCT